LTARAFTRRLVGAFARRIGRPELVGALYPGARRAEQEALAITAILAATLHAGSTYIDVGSNRGQLLREAVRIAPGARHVAFEPIPALAAQIASELPQVECRVLALGAAPGRAQFCHFRKLDGWSGLRRNPQISDERGAPEYIEVAVSTLDEQFPQLGPAVVKIDVEGAELDVLAGGRALLARSRPLVVFEHVADTARIYGASSEALWDLLHELDYAVFAATGEGPFVRGDFAGARGVVNWLATPRSAAA
jgi:FkbM family methyltransferase